MKRKRFLAVACAAAMIASMTTGLAVNVSAADEKSDFAGEELSILVQQDGWTIVTMRQLNVLRIPTMLP